MDDDNCCRSTSTLPERSRMYKSNSRDQNELRRKRRDDEVQIRKSKRADRFDRNRRIAVTRNENCTSESMKIVADGLSSMVTPTMDAAVRTVAERVELGSWTVQRLAKAQILNKLAELYCNRPLSEHLRVHISRIFCKSTFPAEPVSEVSSLDEKCISSLVANLSLFDSDEDVLCDSLQSLSVFLARSVAFRNLALDAAIVPELLQLAAKNLSVHMNRSIMWMVALFCEKLNQYSPDVDEVVPLLEIIATGICSSDTMIQTDATTATVSLVDFQPIYSEVRNYHLPTMLVENLRNDKGTARPSIIGAISSIIQTTSYFTDEMIEAGLLEVLKSFVNVSFMSQEICFILSNICAEGELMIERLITSGVLREVTRVMESAEYRARKEAAFVVCHCCYSPNREHLGYVLEMGMLGAFTDLLTCMDTSLVSFILDALQSLLQFGEFNLSPDYANPVSLRLEEVGCREKLDFLCESQCVEIHIKAYTILERYFDDDEVAQYNEASTMMRTTTTSSSSDRPAVRCFPSTVDETIDRVARCL